MKKLMSFILILCTLLALSVSAFALPFPDVSEKSWYYEDVKWVYDESRKLMSGHPNGDFRPNDPITRAELVMVIYNMSDRSLKEDVKLPFTDVYENRWYTEAIKWAYGKGIIKGKSATVFAPNAAVTRAELAAVIFRYIATEQLAVDFVRVNPYIPDYDKIPQYAKFAAVTLYRAEILKGKNGGVFDPSAKTTRAEAAALTRRLYTLTSTQDHALLKKYGIDAVCNAYIDNSFTIIVPDDVPPSFMKQSVGVFLKTSENTPEGIKPMMDLKITKLSGPLRVEPVLDSNTVGGFRFYVEDELAYLALNLVDDELLIFEYTVSINGEMESYMAYVTVETISW